MPTRLTTKQIEEYLNLEERRKQLEREARQLDAQANEIEKQILAFVNENGGDSLFVKSCGFVLSIDSKPGYVNWKNEFIKLRSHEAAEELIRAAPQREALRVKRLT